MFMFFKHFRLSFIFGKWQCIFTCLNYFSKKLSQLEHNKMQKYKIRQPIEEGRTKIEAAVSTKYLEKKV